MKYVVSSVLFLLSFVLVAGFVTPWMISQRDTLMVVAGFTVLIVYALGVSVFVGAQIQKLYKILNNDEEFRK